MLPDKYRAGGNALYTTFQQLAGGLGTAITSSIVSTAQAANPGNLAVTTAAGSHRAFFAVLAVLNNKDKNVIVKTIDRLEERGWALRKRSPEDRRAFCLYVTPDGERVIEKYWNSLVQRQTEELQVLTPGERNEPDRILGKMLNS